MTRAKAIRLHCLDCGGCTKEVTLCQVFNCALWGYRFGSHYESEGPKKRMDGAKIRYAKEFAEIGSLLRENNNEYADKIQDSKIKRHVLKLYATNSKKA